MSSESDRETIDMSPGRHRAAIATPSDHPPRMPERIGHYRLKRLIASGGMGAVYEAVQDQPRRTVAVKVMRQGMTSRSGLRRFEYEAQILARLRHPGIAQIYEAGTHDDGTGGVPYFVMEYIPGARPVTDFAHDKKLSSRDRLDLFLQVCEAVHHGHQKGIIHRDLKPGNILVDSSGQVKIIDFGVARATDSDLAMTTLQTDVGQLVGTVQYMSPEQIEADPHDIDTRSDVYSLGVLLYELLVEKLPYDVATVAVYEAARIIREQPPTRLSTVNRSLRGDLETIAQKALEKDRARRYQSTTELAQDIRRYLNAEPISARPPSLVHQFRSFARRHRYAFAAAIGIFVALVLGMIGTSWGMVQANEQRRLAVEARDRAQREAERAMTINTFLQSMLTSVDPANAQGEDVTVRDLLDDLAGRLEDAFPNSPETEAELRATIGMTYRNLGQYDEAEPQLRRALELRRTALGEDHPETLRSMTDVAVIVNDLGHLAEAEDLFRDALARQREVLGETDPLVLATTNALAWTVYNQARPAEAEPLFRRTLELQRAIEGAEAPRSIKTITNLAVTLIEQEKLEEAEPLIEQAIALSLSHLGKRHPDTLYARSIQAWLFREQGRYDESIAQYDDIVGLATTVFGADHKFTLFWRQATAWAVFDGGDPVKAERLTRPVLSDRMRTLGAEHPETIDSMDALGRFLLEQDRFNDAEEELRRALAVCERALPDTDYRRGAIRSALARALVGLERYSEAETVAMDYYRIVSRQFGDDDEAMRTVYALLAELYERWGKPDEAEQWRRRMKDHDPS